MRTVFEMVYTLSRSRHDGNEFTKVKGRRRINLILLVNTNEEKGIEIIKIDHVKINTIGYFHP